MQFVDLVTDTDWLRVCTRGAVVTRWATSPHPVKYPIPAPELNAAGFEKNIAFDKLPEGAVDVIDGYHSIAEIEDGDGYRGAILAPWSNRIHDARFVFEGKTYDLGSDENGMREALHGLASDAYFSVTHIGIDSAQLEATVGGVDGYPWQIHLSVTYELYNHGVGVSIVAENVSTTAAPVALGIHPYFRYRGGSAQGASVFVPAAQYVVNDERLIPLDGAAAYADAVEVSGAKTDSFVFAESDEEEADLETLIEGVTLTRLMDLDTAFTNMSLDGDDCVDTILNQPNGDLLLVRTLPSYANSYAVDDAAPSVGAAAGADDVDKEAASSVANGGVVHIFTGEPLRYRPCEAIAIESCQAVTNAFNRDDFQLALQPGRYTCLQVEWQYTFNEL